jgi:predicted ester cyclase
MMARAMRVDTREVNDDMANTMYSRAKGGRSGSAAAHRIIARRFFDDVLMRRSEEAVDQLIAPDAIVDLPTGRFAGPEGVKLANAQIERAFPDLRISVRALTVEGDRVVAEWTLCGTQQREVLGVPPSGRRECVDAQSHFRVEDDKIIEHRMDEG